MRVELVLCVLVAVASGLAVVNGHELVSLNETEMFHLDSFRASAANDALMVGLTLIESAGAKGAGTRNTFLSHIVPVPIPLFLSA